MKAQASIKSQGLVNIFNGQLTDLVEVELAS